VKRAFLFFATVWFWLYFSMSVLFFLTLTFFTWLVTYFFDKRRLFVHYVITLWGSALIRGNPIWRATVEGKEKIDRKKKYVIVSNHQSLLDILLIFLLFMPFKWVAKRELFNVPILGWVLRMGGYISINRGNKESIKTLMKKCEDVLLNEHISVMFFPEGTRSEDGRLKKFKEGAFKLAKQTNTAILPIVIRGTAQIIPKNSLKVKKIQKMHVKVLDEIPVDYYQDKSAEEIKKGTWGVMHEEIN